EVRLRRVALRYFAVLLSYGNSEQVAPISAPMLHTVALPVAEMVDAPGPKYSTIAPVPPFTVSTPATFKMMSFGAVQPESDPESRTPINFGTRVLYGQPAIT